MSQKKAFVADQYCDSLAFRFPECATGWDSARNPVGISPDNVRPYTRQKFFWTKGKRWRSVRSVVINRKRVANKPPHLNGMGKGKAFQSLLLSVSSLAIRHPELTTEWDFSKNGSLLPEHVLDRSGKKVWWTCEEGHSWEATVANRVARKSGCPKCYQNSKKLWKVNPELFTELAMRLNGPDFDPRAISAMSAKSYWWICDRCGGHYKASVKERLKGKSCPCAIPEKPSVQKPIRKERSLAYLNPQLAEEWDYEKNGDLTPWDVGASSPLKVHWKCQTHPNHTWQAQINNRHYKGTPCPECKRSGVVSKRRKTKEVA